MNIFPNLKPGKWIRLDLNEKSKTANDTSLDLTNPKLCKYWISTLNFREKARYSFGGFLEDRSNLWKDIDYLKSSNAFTHLGVDYTVPVGAEVAIPARGEVGFRSAGRMGWKNFMGIVRRHLFDIRTFKEGHQFEHRSDL